MATVAAIRASSSSSLAANLASTPSLHCSSDCRNGPQICAFSRPSVSASAATCLSSSLSVAPSSHSIFRVPRKVKSSARDAAQLSELSTSPRCESESTTNGKMDVLGVRMMVLSGGSSINCKTPFGYTRKDVIGIGVGLLGFGIALKYGLEFLGVDSIKAGNAVQLIMVLGLTIGWISTYVFRVSSKEMTYAKQLKDYENKVMEKRLEEMPEAELESMLAQIEEEKRVLRENRDKLR